MDITCIQTTTYSQRVLQWICGVSPSSHNRLAGRQSSVSNRQHTRTGSSTRISFSPTVFIETMQILRHLCRQLPTARRILPTIRPLSSRSQQPPPKMSRIVWMDMEMTGLDVKTNRIMEVCCVITNNDLDVLATGPELIVHHPQSTLDAMDEWCLETHAKTGMSEACLRSTDTVEQVEDKLLAFLQSHIGPRECPLAGNTIYMDRLFLSEYMPRVNEFLHYRLIDVSTCKELCKRWNPTLSSQAPKKRFVHRGLEDIMESIEELKYYRQFMFTPSV